METLTSLTITGVLQGYIDTIFGYTLPRLRISNSYRSDRRKWFHIQTGNRQTIFHRNYDICGLCRWSSASQIHQPKQNLNCISLEQAAEGIGLYMNANKIDYIFLTKRIHLHLKWQASRISEPVYIPRQQHLINWKWCQCMSSEDVSVIYLMK